MSEKKMDHKIKKIGFVISGIYLLFSWTLVSGLENREDDLEKYTLPVLVYKFT